MDFWTNKIYTLKNIAITYPPSRDGVFSQQFESGIALLLALTNRDTRMKWPLPQIERS